MLINKNHFRLWIISGCLAVIIRDIYAVILLAFGWIKLPIWTIAADLFIDKPEFFTALGTIIGILTDLVIGGILGLLIGIGIDWQEKKNYLLVGIGIRMMAWLVFYGIVFHNLPQTMKNAPHDAISTILSIIGHLIYGIATAWIYIKLLNDKKVKC
jgi:uncharacterized membrane protein (Fun14 family)